MKIFGTLAASVAALVKAEQLFEEKQEPANLLDKLREEVQMCQTGMALVNVGTGMYLTTQ